MDFQYKLIVGNQTFYKEFEIPAELERVKLGSTSNCEFRLNSDFFFEDIEISLEKKENWNILCSDNLYISRGDVRKLLFSELTHDDVVNICYVNSGEVAFEIRFLIDFGSDGTDYSLKIDLSQISELSIGDKSGANIELSTEYGKDTFVSIVQANNKIELIEKASKYGTYVNGKRISKKAVLKDFDFISVADFSAYYKDKQLYFSKRNIRLNGISQIVEQVDIGGVYPMFIRNTRAKSVIEDEKIKILDPDTIPTKPELNIVTSLMPTIVMFALVVVLRGIMSESGGTYVIFSICSMGMGVITSVLNIVHGQNKYKKDCEKRRNVYLNYVAKKKEEIIAARNSELEILRDTYYSTEENLEHIESFSAELFDRTPEDEDFLDIYLGVGKREAERKIEYKEQEKLDTGDDLCQIPTQLSEEYKYIDNAPIYIKAKDANAIGIIGRKERQNEFIKCLLIDIISRQYFGDVNVYAFIDDNVQEYDWLKLIPHIQPNPNFRNIVCDTESKNIVFEYLYKELTYRSEHRGVPGHNVIFILNDNGIKSHPISRFIEHASELNTTFIFFETEKKYLPLYCSQIVVLEENYSAYTYASENKTDKTEFKYACVSSDKVQRAIDILAPVYCEEISLESSLRKNISLFELLGIYSANDLELKTRWNDSKIYETMAVPLGINVKNEVVCLNLHEKFHGPHGLVAGTTGSGKSEILQSFILSAATYFHPYEIGFVIIDFKGGGMVNQFKDLPHLIGAITNIDGNEIQRSLKSIKAELMKRQNHFASAGVNHIDKYIQLYKDGKVTEALPHLIIIVDEFAELKAEQPEFMKELISAARIGRSLGVHLILATQKPSGVVDAQIWSNSKFKLCLKVQSKEDSNEVIKTPLAAEIKEPGRAYLQVGNNEIFELFQSAYSGAPATVDASEVEKEFVISKVGFTGNRKPIYVRKKKKRKINVQNQLDEIVAYIHDYCNKEGIKKLADICMPPLPETLYFDAGKRVDSDEVFVTFGLVDDPDHQSQMTHHLNITAMNYMLIGSTQTGKTNFLQTAIRSLTEHYSPDEVNIYIVDFASMILKNFENLNHVGGVVLSHEDEKVKNLFRLLSNEIDLRKSRLAEVGVSSFASYKEAGYRDLPQIVVVIDNLTALKELYLQDNDMLLPVCRDGNSVGISFLVANGQTAGVGYRYLNNFEGRIALFCNESSEYTMLFEGNRTKLPNVPGRALVQIDKATYECQMYLAFDGDKEYERVQNIQKHVTSCNERYVGMNARVIPEIPKCLDIGYVEKHYAQANTNDELMIGLDYETIEPLSMNLNENDMIVLSGKKDVSRKAFAKYIISVFADKKFGKTELYVLDTLAGKWGELEILPQTAYYTTDADSSSAIKNRVGAEVDNGHFAYVYDELNRLTEVHQNDTLLRKYSYDAFGNRVSKANYASRMESVTSYTYNVNNQLLSEVDGTMTKDYTYDNRGNLLKVSTGADILKEFTFDATNQMTASFDLVDGQRKKATYTYNGLGHRVGQKISSLIPEYPEKKIRYTIDMTRQYYNLLQKSEGGASQTYYWDGNVVGMESNGVEKFYLQDDFGSPMHLVDIYGTSQECFAFDEFGENLSTSYNNTSQTFGFTGYQTDEVGDLYYAQARRYDASVGRFVSEDKVRGFVILPYTLNHYGYCWNNPVDFVDRDGNLPTVVIGAVIGLAAGALGEVVSQTIDGVQSGKSVLDSLLDVNPGKVVLEAGKGAVTGAVAGTGAGLLVVAGTSGVVEFGGDLLDQKVLQKKEDLDYTHAISNGLWSATTTLVVGGITNEISNVIHPEAKTGTMDYLFGRDKAKAVVKAQYNNARSSSSRAKYWNRLEKIKLQKTLGTIKYGIIETGKTIIDEIKNEIYRDEVNEDIVEEIDKKISCSVY